MYVQSTATNGSESSLASSAMVYNEIAATRPNAVKALTDSIWIYDKDEAPAEWSTRSILFTEPKHGPFFCLSRQKITGSDYYPLSPTVPAMTEAQAEALDMVPFTAEKHGLKVHLQCGDMMLYNNLAVLRGREAFVGPKTSKNGRYILRLWLRNKELAWQTPLGLARDWYRVYGDPQRQRRAHWTIRPEDTEKDRAIGHKKTCN